MSDTEAYTVSDASTPPSSPLSALSMPSSPCSSISSVYSEASTELASVGTPMAVSPCSSVHSPASMSPVSSQGSIILQSPVSHSPPTSPSSSSSDESPSSNESSDIDSDADEPGYQTSPFQIRLLHNQNINFVMAGNLNNVNVFSDDSTIGFDLSGHDTVFSDSTVSFNGDPDEEDYVDDSDIDSDTEINLGTEATTQNETLIAIGENSIENNTLLFEYKTLVNNNGIAAAVTCDNNHNVMDDCSICVSTFIDKEIVRRLPCFHLFHKNCIDRWFQSNRRKLCPICRSSITAITEAILV